jgi:hypothetical protein
MTVAPGTVLPDYELVIGFMGQNSEGGERRESFKGVDRHVCCTAVDWNGRSRYREFFFQP